MECLTLGFLAETVVSSPLVAQELSLLKKAFTNERAERIRLQASEMEKVLKGLKPIDVPHTKDNRLNELEKELMRTKRVIMPRQMQHCPLP